MDIRQFFAEYDQLSKTATPEELEQLLLHTCETYTTENPKDARGQSALYNELGAFYRSRGCYEQGETAFLTARTILESTVERFHGFDASRVSCVGCSQMGEDWAPPPPNPDDLTNTVDYATTLNNLAGLYRVAGRYEESLRIFAQVRDRYTRLGDVPTDVYASSYNNTGLVYLDLKQPDLAEEYFKKALAMVESMEGNAFVMGTTFSNIAFVHILRQDNEQAAQSMAQAAQYFLQLEGEMGTMYLSCMDIAKRIEGQK